jgi:hypothetical protein
MVAVYLERKKGTVHISRPCESFGLFEDSIPPSAYSIDKVYHVGQTCTERIHVHNITAFHNKSAFKVPYGPSL